MQLFFSINIVLVWYLKSQRKKNTMLGLKILRSKNHSDTHKYFKCNRCGYISVVKDGVCPICTKDGFTIKMK